MERYFAQWKLGNRVTLLRARFAESVTNTAFYRGHLERNRQSALNAMLAAIALLSLAQVSSPIAEVVLTSFVRQEIIKMSTRFVFIPPATADLPLVDILLRWAEVR